MSAPTCIKKPVALVEILSAIDPYWTQTTQDGETYSSTLLGEMLHSGIVDTSMKVLRDVSDYGSIRLVISGKIGRVEGIMSLTTETCYRDMPRWACCGPVIEKLYGYDHLECKRSQTRRMVNAFKEAILGQRFCLMKLYRKDFYDNPCDCYFVVVEDPKLPHIPYHTEHEIERMSWLGRLCRRRKTPRAAEGGPC